MRTSVNILRTEAPAILEMHEAAARLRSAGRDLLHFGQAVPDLDPPEAALEALREALNEAAVHTYSVDSGIPELRQAVADDYRERWGVALDPDREILITAGANHAFFQALLSVVNPGESVLVPTPYYFNHAMALQMLGIKRRDWPMIVVQDRFALDLDRLDESLSDDTAGIVCVNPNNPTGTVFSANELKTLVERCAHAGKVLFYDEVYGRLYFGEDPPPHPFRVPGGRECTVVLGSFSKMFGITGWRIGYLIAPAALWDQLLKVQDTTIICAPVAGQVLARECLRQGDRQLAEYRRTLKRRAENLAAIVADVPDLRWRAPHGALFAMVACPLDVSSRRLALELLEREGVVTVPGAGFGPDGEGHLRISFGFAREPELDELAQRLRRFFRNYRNR
ncbi:MAG: pyridoxal phosphate-dependent aminotransferase [Acidobacteria bacterium]|nr:pyridoxal phosphate-dependent aminotransferase [Acidobacteriota bacterium]